MFVPPTEWPACLSAAVKWSGGRCGQPWPLKAADQAATFCAKQELAGKRMVWVGRALTTFSWEYRPSEPPIHHRNEVEGDQHGCEPPYGCFLKRKVLRLRNHLKDLTIIFDDTVTLLESWIPRPVCRANEMRRAFREVGLIFTALQTAK